MTVQQIDAPNHRRTTFIAVALLLVALAVGAVTAVRLFPAQAIQRPVAAAPWSGQLGRLDVHTGVAAAPWSGQLGRLDVHAGVAGNLVRSAGAPRRQRPVAATTWSGALGH